MKLLEEIITKRQYLSGRCFFYHIYKVEENDLIYDKTNRLQSSVRVGEEVFNTQNFIPSSYKDKYKGETNLLVLSKSFKDESEVEGIRKALSDDLVKGFPFIITKNYYEEECYDEETHCYYLQKFPYEDEPVEGDYDPEPEYPQ